MNELDPQSLSALNGVEQRPWFKKKRFVVPIALAVVIAGASFMGSSNPSVTGPSAEQQETSQQEPLVTEPETTEEAPPLVEEEIIEDDSPSETASQSQARGMASDYIDTMAFSKKGLIKQLEFEGFSKADATYGANAIDVDWNEQAALAAQNYLDLMSFSRSGLIDQLIFEGYTPAQAEFGVKSVGL